jgi:hypothetical protein
MCHWYARHAEYVMPASGMLFANDHDVGTIVGNYLIQSVPAIHGLIALDISNPEKPVEVLRVSLSGGFAEHWTGWDDRTQRLGHHWLRESTIPNEAGHADRTLAVDENFKDENGKPGLRSGEPEVAAWLTGTGKPHGVVFSR